MLVGSRTRVTVCKYENGTPKVARNAFNIGEVWNPICCHGNKNLSSYCVPPLVEPYCKESNISVTNWSRYLFSSYLIKIWLSVWCHHLANLHILKTWISLERDIWKMGNGIFFLIQTTCLCFKMASIGNMRFSS